VAIIYHQKQLKLNGKVLLEVKAHGCRTQSVLTFDTLTSTNEPQCDILYGNQSEAQARTPYEPFAATLLFQK